MLNVVRRSQIQGLIAVDGSTNSHLGAVEEVWLDDTGRVAYLSGTAGYVPLDQVADISHRALSVYGYLDIEPPENLQRLKQLAVQSSIGEPLGWVEDFLFDWHTGEIAAYVLAGQIAAAFDGAAVLYPEAVETMTVEHLVIRDGAQDALKPESEGLRGFFSEKSQQVQHLVKLISDRVHHLISPQDQPEVVQVKVKAASDEITAAGEHDLTAVQEAAAYLHEQWEGLQQSINRSGERAKAALNSAWQHLTGKS